MDLHVTCLTRLGCTIREQNQTLYATAPAFGPIRSVHLELPFPSRGATINVLLFAAKRPDLVVHLDNANTSPESVCLQRLLRQMGVDVQPVGATKLTIMGTPAPKAALPFTIIADKIEIATLSLAGLLTGGDVSVDNVDLPALRPLLALLEKMGVTVDTEQCRLRLSTTRPLKAADVVPGLNTDDLDADFEPLLAVALTQAEGTSFISDTINPGRHAQFLPYLQRAGARIEVLGPTQAKIFGPCLLKPFDGRANDIRGGASQVLAALAAAGVSTITGIHHIDRGYQSLDAKLVDLGGT